MIKVGLTGNIGSGKTTVTRIFETLGVPVYQADKEARKFLEKEPVINHLVERFGHDILDEKSIDRKKLAAIVFSDRDKLNFLNDTIHPLVKEDLMHWIDKQKDHPYIVQEAAILFESGFYKDFDKNIMVYSPDSLAIRRVMKRDGVGEEEVRLRMQNQWDSRKKLAMSDYVIMNDESGLIIPQVLHIHKELLELTSK